MSGADRTHSPHASEHGAHAHASPSQRLRSLARLEQRSLYVVLVYAVAVGVLSLAAPIGVQALVGAIAFGGLVQPLVVLSLLVLAALGFAAVLRALQWAVVEQIQQRIFVRAAFDVALKLPHALPSALWQGHPRELVNRFFDVVTVQKGAATLLVDGVFVVLQVLVGALVLAFYHPFLFAYAVVLILVVAVAIFPMGRRGVATAIDESKAKYAVVAWFEEVASNTTTFRSHEGDAFATNRARALTADYLEARQRHFKIVFRQGVALLAVQALAIAALLGVGGLLVLQGQITLGQLVAAELIVTSVTTALGKFGKYLESYYDLLAALDKVGHLTDLPLERVEGETPPTASAAGAPLLRVRDVSFAALSGADLLRGVSLDVRQGESIALCGPNGAGKSTLLDLLWATEQPASGTLEYVGIPMRDVDLRAMRREVAFVRDDSLFHGTVAENIRVGRDAVGSPEVRAALELVDLWDEVSRLPAGTSSNITEVSFSVGQARRLLLARAIAGQPKLLLIDGVLDGIDAASRHAIACGVLGSTAPWAVVLTTHDEAVAKLASRTYFMDEGRLDPATNADRAPSPREV